MQVLQSLVALHCQLEMLQGIHGFEKSCSTSLACLFSDWTRFLHKKLCLFSVDWNPTLASHSYLATLLYVRIKDNNNSPHGKFD